MADQNPIVWPGIRQLPGVKIHPLALVESQSVGKGTRIWAYAHVAPGAVVGENCNLGDHTYVEGGACLGNQVTLKNQVAVWDRVHLEDGVFVGPNVTFTNVRNPRACFRTPPSEFLPTRVRSGATLGAGSVLVCGITVGTGAFVAAGAVVTRDVPDYQLVVGVPARAAGWMCLCGLKLDETYRCSCGRNYRMTKPNGLELLA